MKYNEIEQTLANWIEQASSPLGRLDEAVDPARWVAQQFLRWWQPRVEEAIESGEVAIMAAREELNRLGGWENPELVEALHELIHAGDAYADLRMALGLIQEPGKEYE